jgi:hypothetical protein
VPPASDARPDSWSCQTPSVSHLQRLSRPPGREGEAKAQGLLVRRGAAEDALDHQKLSGFRSSTLVYDA